MTVPTEEDIYQIIAAEAPVGRDALDPDATLESLGIASLDVISVLFAVEDRFGLIIETSEFEAVKTLKDFVGVILAKAAAAPQTA